MTMQGERSPLTPSRIRDNVTCRYHALMEAWTTRGRTDRGNPDGWTRYVVVMHR